MSIIKSSGSLSTRGKGGDVTPASLQRHALRRREAHQAAILARKAEQAAWYARQRDTMHPAEFEHVNRTSERHKAQTVTGRGVLIALIAVLSVACAAIGYALIIGGLQ